jgi:hypothetical protein
VHRARFRVLLLALAFACLVREDMGIYVSSFGLYLLVFRKGWRWRGAIIAVAGLAWFLALTELVMPALGGGESYRHANLPEFDGGLARLSAALSALPRELQAWLRSVSTAPKRDALLRLFLPLAAIPLLGSGEQLLWLPGLAMLLGYPTRLVNTLQGWHVTPLLPLLWGSIALTISRLRSRWAILSVGLLLAATLAGFRLWSPFPGGAAFDASAYRLTTHTKAGHQTLAHIPADTSLATQSGLGAHLGARERFYLFPWVPQESPPEIIVLDELASQLYPMEATEFRTMLLDLQMDPKVQILREQDGYFIFKPGSTQVPRGQGPWLWAPWLRLEGYELAEADDSAPYAPLTGRPAPGRVLRVSLYWTGLAQMDTNYSISVRLQAPDGRLLAQDDNWPGRGALPTVAWAAQRTIRDVHYLELPSDLTCERLDLVVIVYRTDTGERLSPAAGHTLTVWDQG